MRQFIKVVVPTEDYKEVTQLGSGYVVHLEPQQQKDGAIECYETVTDSQPDIGALTAELSTWKSYMASRVLEARKKVKIRELDAYDDSTEVNGFIIRTSDGDFTEWLDPYKRNNASRAIESAKKLSIPTITTAIGDIPVTLATEDADLYLAQLEMYAVTCTGVTATHKAAINALSTIEEVESYDFTTGYPEKLVFSIEN